MQQQLILPEGGLASFLTSNIDEFDDSQLAFGRQSGINSHTDIAERMASLGRNGDTELVHAAKGEIVIHPKLLEENPRLAKEMMDAFTNSDVDLSRYVIGSRSNSINPETGQAEFFFKSLKKGLKKLVGGIKKIVKKFAPIIIPALVGAVTGGWGLGLMGQGALAGGITSLVQGGNFKDALKGALLGGAMAGIAGGAKGFMAAESGKGFQGFVSGVKKTFPGQGTTMGNLFKSEEAQIPSESGKVTATNTSVGNVEVTGPPDNQVRVGGGDLVPDNTQLFDSSSKPSFLDTYGPKVKDIFYDQGIDLEKAKEMVLKQFPNLENNQSLLFDKAQKLMTEGSLNLMPTGAAILATGALTGAFDPISATKVDDPFEGPSESEKRLAKNPQKYSLGIANLSVPPVTME